MSEALELIETVVNEYVAFNKQWNNNSGEYRFAKKPNGYTPRLNPIGNERNLPPNPVISYTGVCRYKTKMCRDVLNGLQCPRASNCTYAHVYDELRPPHEKDVKNDYSKPLKKDLGSNGMSIPNDLNDHFRLGGNEMKPNDIIPVPVIPLQPIRKQKIKFKI